MKFKELVGQVVANERFEEFGKLCCDALLSSIADKKTLLPSALMVKLFEEMEDVISNDEKCFEFLHILSLSEFSEDCQSQFLLEFFLNLTSGIFKYISKSYQSHAHQKPTDVPELDLEERQVLYYIGGSIMRGYLKMAKRHKNNSKWQEICSVLKSAVLRDKPEGDIEAQWTADVDRGGLLYITTSMQEFLKKVAVVIYMCEKRDGSIDYESVLTKVSNSDIPVFWDNIVSDMLSEEVSLNLMNDVIMCLSKTCGRGVAKRRLNAIRQKPLISMATRVSVASRKK